MAAHLTHFGPLLLKPKTSASFSWGGEGKEKTQQSCDIAVV